MIAGEKTSTEDMGNQISVPSDSLLGCILSHWKLCVYTTITKKQFILFCNTVWLQYQLGDREKWPETGSLNYNNI